TDHRDEPRAGLWRYGAFIDAGSEGSRIFLLRWRPTSHLCASQDIVFPEIVDSTTTRPGIASFALEPDKAGASLSVLVEFAVKRLAHMKICLDSVPLFLRATAGMRLLDPDQREDILANVREFMRSSPLKFHTHMASVATGEEEGVFGWLSVNYLKGNLNNISELTSETTSGSLDVGGASAQIVFIPEKSIMQHAFPMKLGRHRFQIYSVSFLHLGMREAAHRTATVVISQALDRVQSVSQLDHPCFAKNYIYEPRFAYSSTVSFPIQVQMQGSSNFHECMHLVKHIFEKNTACLATKCSFFGVYQPRLYNSKFLAFAHFAKVADFLALPVDAQLTDLKVASEYVCSLSLEQLNIVFARVEHDYDREHLCFHATFAYTLLNYGYGFEEHSSNIRFQSSAQGQTIDWVVGAMIYEINQDFELLAAPRTDLESCNKNVHSFVAAEAAS
ncbi:unnamed protein product, partial [Polarella glacialis]